MSSWRYVIAQLPLFHSSSGLHCQRWVSMYSTTLGSVKKKGQLRNIASTNIIAFKSNFCVEHTDYTFYSLHSIQWVALVWICFIQTGSKKDLTKQKLMRLSPAALQTTWMISVNMSIILQTARKKNLQFLITQQLCFFAHFCFWRVVSVLPFLREPEVMYQAKPTTGVGVHPPLKYQTRIVTY